jgi:hypothetical protein
MVFAPGFLAGIIVVVSAGPPSDSSASQGTDVTVRGRVVTLGAALQALGIAAKPDPESTAREVVLLGEDRSITPLFRDDASRALFLDERLRDCRAEIQGRRFRGVPYLQVSTFRVEREGKLETPEYFCSVCSISSRYPQICPCCQGGMELRMKSDHR